MAVDRSIVEGLGDELARLYGGLELELARGLGERLARGIDSPDWLQQKLGAAGEVRRWVDGLTQRTARGLGPKADRAVRNAFRLGADAADKELAGRVSRRAVQHALPGTANITRLATQLTGQLQATGPQVVRSALDAYRHVVTQASANVLGGALTRRQAGQRAWNGLLDKGFSGFTDIRGRQWSLAGYVDMATRTTTAQAAVSGQLDRQAAAGIDLVIVSNAPQECERCLIPGTTVEGPAPTWRTRSEYAGNVVTITLASGKDLTGTPNHPVLTRSGWTRLDALREGDEVISYGAEKRYPGVMPDDIQVPALIEEAGKSRAPLTLTRPTRSDLNSYIADGEVCTVFPDGYLLTEIGSAFVEPIRDLLLIGGIRAASALTGLRSAELALQGNRHATSGRMSGRGHAAALIGGSALPTFNHDASGTGRALDSVGHIGDVSDDGMLTWAGRYPRTAQVIADRSPADAEDGAALTRALAGLVHFDKIASLRISEYRGHVWDLSTEPGWFVANGIVTHNCRPWEGKILTRDESGRGGKDIKAEHAIDDKMVTVRVAGSVNEAIAAGLMHPSCRHSLSAYLPGLTQVPTNTEDPKGDAARQRLRALERRARGARLQEAGALTPEGKAKAVARLKATQAEIRQHVADTKDLGIKRKPERERIDLGNARKPTSPVFADARKADDALSSAPISLEGKGSVARGALSERETAAFKGYRSNDFELINGALRMGLDEAGTLLDAEDMQMLRSSISAMDNALARSELSSDVGVYRGVKDGRDVFGDDWAKRLTGAEWVEPAYTSTTASETAAGAFRWGNEAATFRIVVPRGTQAVQLSGRGGESELLLGRGQRFRVIGDTGPESANSVRGRVIDLEVVTDGA